MRIVARKARLLLRRGLAFGLGGASLALIVACSSDPGEPGAQGGASATGGIPGSGGLHTGGAGGLPSASGGSATPGSGGLASGGAQGGATATGGQSSSGMAGQATGGVAGNSGTAGGGQSGGASGGASGGQATSGGTASGGLGGSGVGGISSGSGGQGGVAGASQGGSGGKGGASQGGNSGSGGVSQGGSGGKGGANQGGSAGKGGANQGGGGQGGGGQGGAGGKGGAGGASGCKGGKVVHFVYFVESDQTYSESQRSDIEKQAFKFQEYWFGQLGATFYLAEPVVEVIRADHPAKWYMDTASGVQNDARWWRLDNIMAEVHRKLGIRRNDPNRRVVNYPIARFDGHVGASDGGAWMDGDDLSCMPNNGPTYPYPPPSDSPATCLGHVAHEFGHILGLDHEGPQDGCMIYGFYQPPGGPMCNFGSANVAKIKAASINVGWLNARPGQTCAL